MQVVQQKKRLNQGDEQPSTQHSSSNETQVQSKVPDPTPDIIAKVDPDPIPKLNLFEVFAFFAIESTKQN